MPGSPGNPLSQAFTGGSVGEYPCPCFDGRPLNFQMFSCHRWFLVQRPLWSYFRYRPKLHQLAPICVPNCTKLHLHAIGRIGKRSTPRVLVKPCRGDCRMWSGKLSPRVDGGRTASIEFRIFRCHRKIGFCEPIPPFRRHRSQLNWPIRRHRA